MSSGIDRPVERVDSRSKSRGEAPYVADYAFPGLRYARYLRATVSRARILSVTVPPLPHEYRFITARDIPEAGKNTVKMIKEDWPVFAEREVRYYGEPLGLLVGPERQRLEELIEAFSVEYEELTPAYDIAESLALKGGPIHNHDNLYADYRLRKGDAQRAFREAAAVLEDEFSTGYQEHIYIEPQGLVGAMEEGIPTIYVSTQCPFYVQKAVAAVLGVKTNEVSIKQTVTGGGFGGKEHFPDVLATAVAVALTKVPGPIQLLMERSDDILYSVKRHPSRIRFRAALDAHKRLTGLDVDLVVDGGAYESSSSVVLQRALFSSNSVYDIPNVTLRGRAVATNTVPNDAFRGFGAPQGLFAAETVMSHIAHQLGIDEIEFKRAHLLRKGSVTMTNGTIRETVRLPEMLEHVLRQSDYRRKEAAYARGCGRGIGISLFKHGSAFTGSGERDVIRGRVTIKKRADGRPEIKCSTVEIGQGALTTLRKIVAAVLEIPVSDVLYHEPDTRKVPDSGPTCASRSVAVVGYLLQEAAKKLKGRLGEPGELEVSRDYVHPPELSWDGETLQGDAYPSYSWGVNAVEVAVDHYSYEVTVTGVWTAYDVGRAIDEAVVRGQIEGGAIQGLGYAGLEKMELKEGRSHQASMADYMIPTSLDFPSLSYTLFDNPYEYGPFGAKGAGEVVLDGMAPAYAAAVQKAINRPVTKLPVTPEYIMELIGDERHALYPQWAREVASAEPAAALD